MKQAVFTKPLTISLTEVQYAAIKEFSNREKISMADWVRKLLDLAIANYNVTGK